MSPKKKRKELLLLYSFCTLTDIFYAMLYHHRLHPPRIPYHRHGYVVVLKPVSNSNNIKSTDSLHRVRMELEEYMDLHGLISTYNFRHNRHFSEYLATKDYYRATLLGNLSTFDSTDPLIQDEKASIEQEIIQLDQQFPCVEDYQRMLDFSKETCDMFRRLPNRFFLVLQATLDHWDTDDTGAQVFRLYYVCVRNSSVSWTSSAQNHHVHISSHSGYDLDRTQEFLRQHGHHALAIPLMVKHGFFNEEYSLPKLNTFRILSTAYGVTPRHHLSKENLRLLIEKAIAYIQAFVRSNGNSILTDDTDSSGVRSFLRPDETDSGTGDLSLCQHADDFKISWMCVEHFPQDPGTDHLWKFVDTQGGTIDLHYSTIRIQLTSKTQAHRLATFRLRRRCLFEIFLHIAWSASAKELQEIIHELTRVGFNVLHVHEIASNIALKDHILSSGDETNLTILYNYPRPAENRVVISLKHERRHEVLSVLLQEPAASLDVNWRDL